MFDSRILEECVTSNVAVHAIVSGQVQLEVPKGVTLHRSPLGHGSFVFDRTPIVWFGGKDGDVVAFLRPFSGGQAGKGIVEYLKTQP